MNEELLQQGVAALKAGRKDEARRLLERLVQVDPRSEQGWLWLSGAVDTDEERRFCMTQVLSINRRNALARRGLEALGPGAVRSPLTRPEEPPEQPAEEPPVIPAADITCPRCDAVNPPDFRFCDQCGATLGHPALNETQPVIAAEPLPTWKTAPPPTPKPARPAPTIERRPQRIETQNTGKKKPPALVAIIVVGLGCLLVIGGGLGLMEGDPSGLICWVPGIILMVAGFILNSIVQKRVRGR